MDGIIAECAEGLEHRLIELVSSTDGETSLNIIRQTSAYTYAPIIILFEVL